MKQIKECLDRVFQGTPPLKSKKWKAFVGHWLGKNPNHLFVFHYHHLVLVYDTMEHKVLYEWWERSADKRGLDSAKEYLSNTFCNKEV